MLVLSWSLFNVYRLSPCLFLDKARKNKSTHFEMRQNDDENITHVIFLSQLNAHSVSLLISSMKKTHAKGYFTNVDVKFPEFSYENKNAIMKPSCLTELELFLIAKIIMHSFTHRKNCMHH